ncbi:MAG: CpsB/CapC family capsule biosynthesis tyrosine phosphatase [Allomuricauda sp.]|jgi:tyrosine-protein phosphatase YwqE|uniref:tyrosine-protein phosphatase n=1 Tax=Allomuricauda sp. CP2A TaxID=1848189 RepID=UPI000835C748|nr:CpsB/CapC family capsule biosynthesis tyrosine phosphatase [Muricauda sp. CP2A]
MLSFFSRKEFLVDHLGGLVDIHNHILPGIDDGAKTVEDSIALIKGFGEFGVTRFVCTPHIMHNYYPNTPETIQQSFEKLKNALNREGMDGVSLDKAAEHMIDDNFEQLLRNDQIMLLRKYHLLVEMSFLQPPINMNSALDKVISGGLFPVLAHPERYLFLSSTSKRLRAYKEKGALFQVNLLSLANYYGSDVKSKALKLMENNLIDFVGSDVHNMQQLKSLKEATITKKMGKMLDTIVNDTIEQFY